MTKGYQPKTKGKFTNPPKRSGVPRKTSLTEGDRKRTVKDKPTSPRPTMNPPAQKVSNDYFDYEPDAKYLLKTVRVNQFTYEKCKGLGVIVDFSNAHGLCFGVVFPTVFGSQGRNETLAICWFEPHQVEIL